MSRIIESSIPFDIYPAFLYVDFNRYLFDLPTAYYITLSQKTVYAYHFLSKCNEKAECWRRCGKDIRIA